MLLHGGRSLGGRFGSGVDEMLRGQEEREGVKNIVVYRGEALYIFRLKLAHFIFCA